MLFAKFDYIGIESGNGSRPEDYAALWLDDDGDQIGEKNDSTISTLKIGKNAPNREYFEAVFDNAEQRLDCVVNTDSSLAQNLRSCSMYHTNDSPLVGDDGNSASGLCDEWVDEVIYYVDLNPACFSNFQGGAVMADVHASPSKGEENSVYVQWEECVY